MAWEEVVDVRVGPHNDEVVSQRLEGATHDSQ